MYQEIKNNIHKNGTESCKTKTGRNETGKAMKIQLEI